ncbi:DUF2721 domain-containing protein [Fulvivirga sediminis]|uniref:DUF2721 domain-containing protein n=1 Tax=Fulvivirga sediminis TaxID=2803949 RepID=A0A937F819_9BACT|nr:DUF2721 domain-containing protein [Fulvivirga sediminis]MBL3655999.1 DUF2721 domain-containing protein [Fulvivirga sediminis]
MSITLTTPALLFPAISLLLLAYTNRFLAIASLIRSLNVRQKEAPKPTTLGQIKSLKSRLRLIKNMQITGVFSFFLCVLSMFLLFQEHNTWGEYVFGVSIIALLISLAMSLQELVISTKALHLELSDMEHE